MKAALRDTPVHRDRLLVAQGLDQLDDQERVAVGPVDEGLQPPARWCSEHQGHERTDWRSGEAMVWLKQRTDQPEAAWAGGRPAQRAMNPCPGMPSESCTEQLGIAGPWHERLPHFRPDLTPSAGEELQSEHFLPREVAPAAIAAIRGIADLVAPVLHIAEVRTVRADDLWLSPAYGRDSVTFHFTWVKDAAAVMPALAAVEERLMPMGARPHWAKLTTVAAPKIIARYERAAEFEQLAYRYDPTGKFRNRFVDNLLPAR
jgi:xylitol oxidase